MHFTKMHGLGNDYLYVYGEVPSDVANLSIRLSDRHFGAGSDGMIFITPAASPAADFTMRIFNADGSEARMCGNGIRCVGKYVYDKGLTDKTSIDIDTLSGIKHLVLQIEDGKACGATVSMGHVVVSDELPVQIESCGEDSMLVCTPINVGTPPAVFFVSFVCAYGSAGAASRWLAAPAPAHRLPRLSARDSAPKMSPSPYSLMAGRCR